MFSSYRYLAVLNLLLSACQVADQSKRHVREAQVPPTEPSGLPPAEESEEGATKSNLGPMDQVDSGPKAPEPSPPRDLLKPLVKVEEAKKRVVFQAVTRAQVLADFDRTSGRGLRPRILAKAEDFQRLKDLLQGNDPYVKGAYESLRLKAESFLNEPLEAYQLDDARLRIPAPHRTQAKIATLALLYRWTGERRYADKVKAHLMNYSRFPDWNDARHFLDTGIMAYSMAIGFDWIYDTLTADERRIVSQAILQKGIKPYLDQSAKNPFWYRSQANWNPICNGGISLAALAILDQSAEARERGADALIRAFEGLPHYIREFEPDGQSVEGLMYFDYGLSNLIRWSETLKRSLGQDYGYTETKGLQKAGYFPLSLSGPVAGLAIGDDSLKTIRSDTQFWFAKRFRNPFLAQYHMREVQEQKKYDWFDLLFYEPSLLQRGQANEPLPRDNYIRDIEIVSFRSSWKHEEALYVSIHGGNNAASHGHLDAGSFAVQGYGKVWAIGGLGNDTYTSPGYFSSTTKPDYFDPITPITTPGRFHFYRLRAEGKNTLVFNPDVRPDQNPQGIAHFRKILSSEVEARAVLDLSAVYNRDALKVERGIALENGRRVVRIQDEIQTKAPARVFWFLHAIGSIRLMDNGRAALLEQGNERMWVALQSPIGAQFTVMPAEPLLKDAFPETLNSPNTYLGQTVRKLAIERKGLTRETLTITMTRLGPSENRPAATPASRPLSEW